MIERTYLILLADRKRALFFIVGSCGVEKKMTYTKEDVPQKVKHGDDIRDATDKIFRHIQDHLHRHLFHVGKKAEIFVKGDKIAGVILGSHKTLFPEIKKNLPAQLTKKIKAEFIADLKSSDTILLKKAGEKIAQIEHAS